MTSCVTYLRVSGDGQILKDGFPRQREACQHYAIVQSLDIVAEFRDEGVTGKMELEGRSGLSACLQYIREHQIGLVLVESSDRLARDMIIAEVIVREFQKAGVKVIAASGGIDLTEGNDANPTAKLIRQILAAISEWDRCVISIKLRGARDRMRAKLGKCEGPKTFGCLLGEAEILAQMISLRMAGHTCREIAYHLDEMSLKTRSGGRWSPGTISKILARQN